MDNLSPDEISLLWQMWRPLLETEEVHWEFIRFCGSHHPDAVVLRFLRARKWNAERGTKMLMKALRWRMEFDIKTLIHQGESQLSDHILNSGMAYFHKEDKQNRPVMVLHAKLYDPQYFTLDEAQRFCIYMIETGKEYIVDETATLLFDMRGFSLSNFDYHFVTFFVNALEAYYPESLGACYVVDAPFVFNTVWTMIQGLLDPVIATKIKFVKLQELQEFIAIDKLQKQFGGTDTWEYSYPGADEAMEPDETAWMKKGHLLLQETRKWIDGHHNHRDRAAKELLESWKQLKRPRTMFHKLNKARK